MIYNCIEQLEHKERHRSDSHGHTSNTSNEHKHKESKHKDKHHKEPKSKEVNEQKESTSTQKEPTASVDIPKHDTHYVEQVLHHHKVCLPFFSFKMIAFYIIDFCALLFLFFITFFRKKNYLKMPLRRKKKKRVLMTPIMLSTICTIIRKRIVLKNNSKSFIERM